jgi:hypothetical protein
MEWTGRGARAFAFAVVMLLLSVVAVALRFISRGRILRVWGPSDWFIALTLVGDSQHEAHRTTGN